MWLRRLACHQFVKTRPLRGLHPSCHQRAHISCCAYKLQSWQPWAQGVGVRLYSTETRIAGDIKYVGVFEDKRLIEGRMVLPDGREYQGKFATDGHIENGGVMVFDEGEYKGQFKNWSRHGTGRTVYKSGHVEDGIYEDNVLISGTVTMKGADSPVVFEGELQNGEFLRGTLRQPGMSYEGDFKGGVPHGTGQTIYDNGMKHKGQYSEGQFHGKGTLIAIRGEVYAGVFENGKLYEGSLQYVDGSRYEGEFNEEGELHGAGEYTNGPTAHIYSGYFENGSFKEGQVLDEEGYPVELKGVRISDFHQ
mmetsp:Transcript_16810/g.30057  ORF Transcript_16810/g.30057 Transcript_16810/m.30057 type:complete len:306 (-) Transcript_16810:387-1304(-)